MKRKMIVIRKKAYIHYINEEYQHTDDDVYDDYETQHLFNTLNKLDPADRIILCLYAEMKSLRKVAKFLGLSYATVRKAVANIKNNFIDIYNL